MKPINQIRDLFYKKGHLAYGEGVTELEHALQAAQLAEKDNAPNNLIAGALLHDIGHLLHELPEDIAEQGIDARHEEIGKRWLERYFAPEVSQPVSLHVEAKRYQCTINPDYLAQLSAASAKSYILQGGKMTEDEIRAFEKNPFFSEALQLRTWDDEAKDPELKTPTLDHYLPLVQIALVSDCTSP